MAPSVAGGVLHAPIDVPWLPGGDSCIASVAQPRTGNRASSIRDQQARKRMRRSIDSVCNACAETRPRPDNRGLYNPSRRPHHRDTAAPEPVDLTHIAPRDKAEILAQALPYIRKFHGKTMVIKYGGNAMTDPALQQDFAEDVVLLKLVGMNPVVVHGGGPQIERRWPRLGKKGEFIQGMRVTDAETMEVVEWVLAGEVQQDIVGLINAAGGKAVGLTGRDGGMIRARKLKMVDTGRPEQGARRRPGGRHRVASTPAWSRRCRTTSSSPSSARIGFGEHNESYNINADVVAASWPRC